MVLHFVAVEDPCSESLMTRLCVKVCRGGIVTGGSCVIIRSVEDVRVQTGRIHYMVSYQMIRSVSLGDGGVISADRKMM
jgi:hypothetical protein